MDPLLAFNEYIMNGVLEATSAIVGPLTILTLLASTLVSLLLNQIHLKTITGAHLTIFLFTSVATNHPVLMIFEILARTFIVLTVLKTVGKFFAWIGERERGFGLRALTLVALGVVATLMLGRAVGKLHEQERWEYQPVLKRRVVDSSRIDWNTKDW